MGQMKIIDEVLERTESEITNLKATVHTVIQGCNVQAKTVSLMIERLDRIEARLNDLAGKIHRIEGRHRETH